MTRGVSIGLSLLAATLVVHFSRLDGIVGVFAPAIYPTQTNYAARYSDARFRRIQKGMTENDVVSIIGEPLSESWTYSGAVPTCRVLWYNEGILTLPKTADGQSNCGSLHLNNGMTRATVSSILGPPSNIAWMYTESRTGRSFRQRIVEFNSGVVSKVVAEFYID
jgi:outer membrane protein assembly factor BamE (lipoprotein component of BamABCDE complex)